MKCALGLITLVRIVGSNLEVLTGLEVDLAVALLLEEAGAVELSNGQAGIGRIQLIADVQRQIVINRSLGDSLQTIDEDVFDDEGAGRQSCICPQQQTQHWRQNSEHDY